MRRTTLTVIALAATLLLTACTGPRTPDDSPTSTPTPSPTPTPLTAPASTDELVRRGMTLEPALAESVPDVEPCPELSTDRLGTYRRVCLRPDAPVITFDPDGPLRWLLQTDQYKPYPLDAAFVTEQLAATGRFTISVMVDPPAQWDDSPDAWATTDAEMNTFIPVDGVSLRDDALTSDHRMGIFNAGEWRDGAGLRPGPTTPEGTRLRVVDLRRGHLTYRHGEPLTAETVGLGAEIEATSEQIVLDEQGTSWLMRRQVSTDVGTRLGTRSMTDARWRASYDVVREVEGGAAALPVLPTSPVDLAGWDTRDEHGLQVAVPPGTTVEEPETSTDPRSVFTLPGSPQELVVRGPSRVPQPGVWYAVRGYDNYGLQVSGASAAAAEVGPADDDGNVVVDLTVQGADEKGETWQWTLTWATTPQEVTTQVAERAGWLTHVGVPRPEPAPAE